MIIQERKIRAEVLPGGGKKGDGLVIGTPLSLQPTKYHLSSIDLKENLEIVGPVVMVVDKDFDIGNNTVTISGDGSLELYVGGDIKVSGNGAFNNTEVPSKLIIFGTHPPVAEDEKSEYNISVSGNGAFTGVLYAPNAAYTSNGGGKGGETKGAIIAHTVTFNGSPGPFHYDEALGDLEFPFLQFSLAGYQLLKPGDDVPGEWIEEAVGKTEYSSLFNQLFHKSKTETSGQNQTRSSLLSLKNLFN